MNLSRCGGRTVESDPQTAHVGHRWWRGRRGDRCISRCTARIAFTARACGQNPYLAPSPAPAAPSTDRLPTCTTPQLALAIDVLGGSPTIVLRHVQGQPCHRPGLPVHLMVKDRAGRPVRLVEGESDAKAGVGGDFSPDFERLINLTYLPDCDQRGPFRAFVNIGPYSARRRLSGREVGCFG